MPMYQNTTEMVAYVETANTSHASGRAELRPHIHRVRIREQPVSQPWTPHVDQREHARAHTAKIVIASANRLIELRHVCLNSSRIAEISVPAWPMPIHHTKLMIANPHAPGIVDAPDAHALQEQPGQRDDQDAATLAGHRPARRTTPAAYSGQHDARNLFVTDLKLWPGAITAYSPVRGSIIGSIDE